MGCAQSAHDKNATGGISVVKQAQFENDEVNQAAALVVDGAKTELVAKVEISIGCRNLPKMDLTSKSDPLAVLYKASGWGSSNWVEVARTDVLMNTHDPDFTRPLVVEYTFEILQPLRVIVFDVDSPAGATPEQLDLGKQEYIGESDFLLSDLMTAPSQELNLPIVCARHGRRLPLGCLVMLRAEELAAMNATVRLAFSAMGLENKELFSKSDPFLRMLKLRECGEWIPVLKTEVIDNNLNPAWRAIDVDIRQLCNADKQRPLKMEVWDYENSGSHKFIGECQTSLSQLQEQMSLRQALTLLNPAKAGKAGYQHSGVVVVREATIMYRPSFLQYITGGLQLNFMVAIDFTGSNGDPRCPTSLHFLSTRPTVYEQAIRAVGSVLAKYDTDQMYPVYGFGAAVPPYGAVSHCFRVGSGHGNPEVQGVNGIIGAYKQCLPTLKLSGPTLFAPCIEAAASVAREASQQPGSMSYLVLLILTDGCIMDLAATSKAIVEASMLPLSILIVGVGDADFSAMEVLDGDKEPLQSNGRYAARDIVQFVPLRQAQRGGPQEVAKQLLAEIPGQVVGYFHGLRNVQPPTPGGAPWKE